jgi:hypothetical protein
VGALVGTAAAGHVAVPDVRARVDLGVARSTTQEGAV